MVSALAIGFVTCGLAACASSSDPLQEIAPHQAAAPAPSNDGIALTTATPERITGVYKDTAGDTITFDLAKVGDDLYADVTGNAGRPILHIDTSDTAYDFSYMGGALTLHTTKEFVAQARAQAQVNPEGTSTSGFVFSGDMSTLGKMMNLPEVRQFATLSRALGARGYTGNDFPAVLVLHKVAQQSAQALSVNVPKLDTPESESAYCQAYPNQNNDCFGMCGPGCDCWSWVCGDCCYHSGCAQHDTWCRDGEWWWCDNITAVVALFGC
jgi:hypothetical protein